MDQMMHFAQPLWLGIGGAVLLAAFIAFRILERQRRIRLERFAAASLLGRLTRSVSPRRRLLKKALWLAAIACCFLALARPQYGFRMIDVKRKGIDILFALDTSKSMLTEDIRPNRLERAKLAIMDFVARLDGDRVGLLPFAGTGFLMTPLTIDYSAFEESLAAVNTSIVPKGGTDLATAIAEAETTLGSNANHKILILLTDGENLEGDALAAAKQAAAAGMTIFTVGVGTTTGELIPLPDKGAGSFVKDDSGKLVTSKLDEKTLMAIAEATGGIYVPLGKNGEGLDKIYQQKLTMIPKKELAEKQHKEPLERFRWPLGGALLLLALEFTISSRKSERVLQIPFVKTVGRRLRTRKGVSLSLLLVILVMAGTAHASQGEKAYTGGDYLGAAEWYDKALKKTPDDPRLHYNAGTTAYKNNLYDQAISSFQQALKSDDLGLQEQAYFNLGNALYKRGDELMQSDPGQTAKLWQQALDAYDGSSKLNPQAVDGRENRQLVAKKLEELQKKQEEQNKQNQDQQQQNQQQKNDQQQNQQQKKNGDDKGQSQQDQAGQQDKGKNGDKPTGSKSTESDQNKSENGTDKPGEQSASGQQKEKQKPSPVETREGSKDEDKKAGTPEAVNGSEEKNTESRDGRQEAVAAGERMSPAEAKALLERLKEEEGRLNFVPGNQGGNGETEKSWKDW